MSDQFGLHRFFVPESIEPGQALQLPQRVTDQVRKVLRLRVDDRIVVFNGTGVQWVAKLTEVGSSGVTVLPEPPEFPGPTAIAPRIHLGIALIKGDRTDWVIQKATELGVASITPIEAQRCVVSLRADRAQSRVDRWRRIAIEALEQSGRTDAIAVGAPISFEAALQSIDAERGLIAWERERSVELVDAISGDERSVALLIGPEGGFTEDEVETAKRSGFAPVSLGQLILRSETAAIAAPAMIQAAVASANKARAS